MLACVGSTDTMLLQYAWWMRLPVGICLALVVDGLLGLVLRATGRHRGGTWRPGLVAGTIFAGFLSTSSMTIAHALLAVVLAVRFGVAAHRTAPELRWARGAVVAAIVFSFSLSSLPSQRSTAALIKAERFHRELVASSWMEEELMRRPDAIGLVESEMDRKGIDPKLLRLHYVLGGPRSARNSMCSHVRAEPNVGDQTREICRLDDVSRE